MLSSNDIKKLAQLARLKLTAAERKIFQQDIAGILRYVEQLNEVDIDGVAPTSQVTGLINVLRDDEPKQGLTVQDLQAMTPITKDHYVQVPRVLENSGDE